MHRSAMFVITAAFLAGCGTTPNTGTAATSTPVSGKISVFAAASLTDSFKALGSAFQSSHTGVTVQFNFAGTPTLVTQIEQGAPADVFASADTTNMDKLKRDGDTVGTPAIFAHNQLEIAIAAFLLRCEDALQLPFTDFLYGDLSPIAQGTRLGQAFTVMELVAFTDLDNGRRRCRPGSTRFRRSPRRAWRSRRRAWRPTSNRW